MQELSRLDASTVVNPQHWPQRAIDEQRRALIDEARRRWIDRLIDVSRRNSLLYFRPTSSALELDATAESDLRALFDGQAVRLSRLVSTLEATKVNGRARTIRRRAVVNLEEKGIQTLFLALGMATWPISDGGRPPAAPVLLLPVDLEVRGREEQSIYLRRRGDIQFNIVLRYLIEYNFGIFIDVDELLADIGDETASFDREAVFQRLCKHMEQVNGFRVAPQMVLSNFSFQKLAMVKDLRDGALALYYHDVIAAIAGDSSARERLRQARRPIDPRELDRVPPQHEFLVLDADSSQQRAIASVLDGQTGVIQGPPGTGKSQTITNLIAAAVAHGKRVLFVAEKRAALEVVLRRLQSVGLDHLALDLHGADVSRRRLAERFASCLALVREPPSVDTTTLDADFSDRRERLNSYVERLHKPCPPLGLSLFEIQGRLLRLPPGAVATTRWRGLEVNCLTRENVRAVREWLIELSSFPALFRRRSQSPWNNAPLQNSQQVDRASELITNLLAVTIPQLRAALRRVSELGLRPPDTITESDDLTALLAHIAATLSLYQRALFEQDLATVQTRLEPARAGGIAATMAWFFNAEYCAVKRSMLALRHAGPVPDRQIYSEIVAAHEQLQRWQRLCGDRCSPVPEREAIVTAHDGLRGAIIALRAELEALAALLDHPKLLELSFTALEQLLKELDLDILTAHKVVHVNAIEQRIRDAGAGAILDELRHGAIPPEHWPLKFEHAYLSSCLHVVRSYEPALASFDGRLHERYVADFCRLDRERLSVASQRVRRVHGERVIEAMNRFPEQADMVRREVEKRRRHLPLRCLLDLAPDVLLALCPCWMASPLSISQLIDARRYFDLVIFDEASQVLPEDAIAALLRASQVVVAGDRHQLPPTTFFAAGEDEDENSDEEPGATEGFESLLDVMATFNQPWSLDWHYRSQDEALIAFANHHIYGNRLVTFPGTGKTAAISHILVPSLQTQDGQEESASAEVRRVVDLVLEHATTRPDETLGVIAMGIRHADRVQAALDDALRARPDLDAFFSEQRAERFFVKNLERVQGDERDAIILTVGYGKDRAGRLPYRFGPLLREGGERRLNVAITRARRRLTLVSSFDHNDMDPARTRSRGVELLRLYLQYAASGGGNLGDSGMSDVPLNPFEADVFDALTARGVRLIPQWGVSKYRIDMVALHPEKPGRFVLAIECDGATYHAAPTARDRDRLRQQHLEGLGWRFHRIWSTDWFTRREQEIARALAAYEMAVARADQDDQFIVVSDEQPLSDRGNESGAGTDRRSAKPYLDRGPRPAVPWYGNIDHYTDSQLFDLLDWIRSDGRLRTDQELTTELMHELGFKRRGARIATRLKALLAQDRTGRRRR